MASFRKKGTKEKTPLEIHKENEKNKKILFTIEFRRDGNGDFVKKLPGCLAISDYDMLRCQGHILEPSEARCFNDEILNSGLRFAVDKIFPDIISQPIRVSSTTFYSSLTTPYNQKAYADEDWMYEHLDSYCRVINDLKYYDIFSMDWVFVPINSGFHWSAAVLVQPRLLLSPSTSHACKVFHVDSLNYHDTATIGEALKHYILQAFLDDRNAEERDKHDELHMRMTIAEIEVTRLSASQQLNNSDCGVYVDIFFERLLRAYKESVDAGLVY